MNKNTARRLRAYRKANRGSFPTPAYKAKAKPFPKPDKDANLTMTAQSLMFYGTCSPHFSRP